MNEFKSVSLVSQEYILGGTSAVETALALFSLIEALYPFQELGPQSVPTQAKPTVPKNSGSLHIYTKRCALDELAKVMSLIEPSRELDSDSALHVFPEW